MTTINFQELWEEAKAREDDVDVFHMDTSGNPRHRGQVFNISRETYLEWKAMSGNSKARRRWRRRNIPNSQALIAQAEALHLSPGGGEGLTLTATHPGVQGDRLP